MPFAIVHARDEAAAAVAIERLSAAVMVAESAPAVPSELIVRNIPARNDSPERS
jgi:hypothetical protein